MAYGNQKAAPQRTTASGVQVTTMDIQGKAYVPVAARIAEVNISSMVPRYEIAKIEEVTIGGLIHCRATILIDGNILEDGTREKAKQFVATAVANFGATKGIDAKSPWENAETSAIGRALGLAGFGSLESVASAEEVINAINRDPVGQKPTGNQSGNGNASGQGFKPTQQVTQPTADLAELRKRFGELKDKLLAFKEDEDNINAVVAAHKADPAKMVEMLEKAYLVRCINDAYLEDFPKGNPELIEKAMDKFKSILGAELFSLTLDASNPALKPSVEVLKKLLVDIQQMSA